MIAPKKGGLIGGKTQKKLIQEIWKKMIMIVGVMNKFTPLCHFKTLHHYENPQKKNPSKRGVDGSWFGGRGGVKCSYLFVVALPGVGGSDFK